ncbi:MAG: hypothetical protein QM758_23560 [Armatimonas sp.]
MIEAASTLLQIASESEVVGQRIWVALQPLYRAAAEQVTKEQAALSLKIMLRLVLSALNVAGVIVGAGDLAAVLHD